MTDEHIDPSLETWATNARLDDIADDLLGASRVAVLTHARPDGDAVGSTLAVTRALRGRGIEAWPVYTGHWTPRFDRVIGTDTVLYEEPGCWEEAPLDDIDAVVILDTGSWNQLAEAREFIEAHYDRAIVIDHHRHGDPDVAPKRIINTSAAAACEIVADLCRRICNVDSAADLPANIAEALYMGLATDTGWFRHSNVTPDALRLAGDLLEAGVDHDALYEHIEQNDRPARLALMHRALGTLEYFDNDRIAVMSLSMADFRDCGADIGDAGGFADLPRMIGAVRACAVLIEMEPTLAKVSFRSKGGDDPVDVNAAAKRLGGGGHIHAAGAKLNMPLADARKAVIDALLETGRAT